MMPKIKVLVADDHTILRDGICALLALAEDMEVVGEASNGSEALEMVGKVNPDVVLMDIAMPIMNGLEAMLRLHKEFPRTRVLVLTQYDDREYVLPAIQAGALGFISKIAASSELISGIRSVYRGDSFLSPSVAKFLVQEYQHEGSLEERYDPYQQLTDREREILKLIAEGYTTRQIAEMLVVSMKTVEGHRSNLMAKLDIHDRIGLVKYALQKGIITF
jgi:DNA-binding NarL/FixJ family response regulator